MNISTTPTAEINFPNVLIFGSVKPYKHHKKHIIEITAPIFISLLKFHQVVHLFYHLVLLMTYEQF